METETIEIVSVSGGVRDPGTLLRAKISHRRLQRRTVAPERPKPSAAAEADEAARLTIRR